MTIETLISNALAAETPNREQELVKTVYWYALSLGQERAESKIRENLETLELGRYHGEQRKAVGHVLKDNPCATKAPVLPDFKELGSWEVSK